MSVLIVANVVSGAVVASYRQIGVLKSIGFSPAQVVVAYVVRVGLPALAGCLIGVAAGNLLTIPVLHKSAASFGVGRQPVPAWVNVVIPVLALVALTALAPAVRAGRLSAVQAITLGHAPRQGRGYAAHRLASRLRLPRPVSMGLAAPFARPARTAGTLAAIMFGVTAVIFAVGVRHGHVLGSGPGRRRGGHRDPGRHGAAHRDGGRHGQGGLHRAAGQFPGRLPARRSRPAGALWAGHRCGRGAASGQLGGQVTDRGGVAGRVTCGSAGRPSRPPG